MRKRTFQDRKFSAGDANSNAYRDSWDRMFGPRMTRKTGHACGCPVFNAIAGDCTCPPED